MEIIVSFSRDYFTSIKGFFPIGMNGISWKTGEFVTRFTLLVKALFIWIKENS